MRKPAFFLLCLLFLAGAASGTPEASAPRGQVEPYKVRAGLLMDATRYTGVFTPEEAATVWATGLRLRSAAMQYTVMTDRLKTDYVVQLGSQSPNWVTGMSSPWVEGFRITWVRPGEDGGAEVALRFETRTSYGAPEYYDAKLWVIPEAGFRRIDGIWTEEGLYPYTLYKTGA